MSSTMISSPRNPRVKSLLELRDQRARRRAMEFVIDGPREIRRACEADWRIVQSWVCPNLLRDAGTIDLRTRLRDADAEEIVVSPEVWEKITFGNRAEGLLAVATRRQSGLADIPTCPQPLFLVLEGVEKPGNLGAVARTVDAVGASGLLLADPRVDWLNPNVIRASAGAIFSVPVAEASCEEITHWLNDRSCRMVVAQVKAERTIYELDGRQAIALILGAEAQGVVYPWRNAGAEEACLPMRGRGDSLNLSVTAAVMSYEVMRQRGAARGP